MIKWPSIALLCAFFPAGCAINSQPVPGPTSNAPIIISNPNQEASLAGESIHRPRLAIKVTQFADYDYALAERINNQWHGLLENGKFSLHSSGKVKVNFILHSDGSVSDTQITENDVGDLLGNVCVRAIQSSSPFPKWTPEMVEKLGGFIKATFTFDFYAS